MEIDVEVVNVTKTFGEFVAVNDVSFAIPKGEFFSLLGPSGCGKTTIMRMISGFGQQTSGQIRIAGRDMSGIKPYQRPTNLVFQHLALFPHLSVARNIAFGLEMAGERRPAILTKVAEALDLVQLQGYADRRIDQLSGGQRQRVAIARALVKRPTVLLLDEPLGALDLKLREQMQIELKRIQREAGTTFIYVTHDQREAITMSDKIAVINKGRIEQIDTASAIYEHPSTSFVAGFIGDTNFLHGRLTSVSSGHGVVAIGSSEVQVPLNFIAVAGDAITLSVRPEHLHLGPASNGACNSFSARVDDVIYLGSLSHYRLALDGGIFLTAEVQNRSNAPISRGDATTVSWKPEAATAFPAVRG
ncbi:ABC transporter ATP-binding protein [Rhizobium sp. NXC14]|uniref:ABC transporter ATP-binding protein n=1 Tax=Rhizobium sp. NXC14 TaxID=1981173 RepID=UPI001FDA4519|nr:ABC transporter ATP-binding protein [Rhizobium sp. NXC14]